MAIGTVTYGAVSANSGNAVSLTPGYPASPAAGELLAVWAYCRANGVTFGLSGWDPVASVQTANGSYALFSKAAAGGESGTVTVTSDAPALGAQLARMMLVPGGETVPTIYSGTPSGETEAAGSPVTNSGTDPSVAGSLVCLFTGKGDGGNGTTNDYAGWAGNSLTWAGVANGTTAGSDAAIGIGTAVKSGTGATGNLTATNTLTFVGVSYSIAIKPATTVVNLTGTLAVAAALSGNPAQQHNLANTLSVAATLSGAPTVEQLLSGTLAAQVTLSGGLDISIPLSGTLAVSSSLAGELLQEHLLAATLSVTSTLQGNPGQDHLLAGTMAAAATVSGSPIQDHLLADALQATMALAGTPAVEGSFVALSGTLSVACSLSAEPLLERLLSGSLPISASLSGAPLLERLLAGTLLVQTSLAGIPVTWEIPGPSYSSSAPSCSDTTEAASQNGVMGSLATEAGTRDAGAKAR